jgi:hypothetical protein
MKVTEHFTMAELTISNTAIRHGITNLPSSSLYDNIERMAKWLETLRLTISKPIIVLSCYRSVKVNRLVGGSPNSAHMLGLAADIQVRGISNKKLAEIIKSNFDDYDQLILEFPPNGWVHVGLSLNNPRQQELTAMKIAGVTKYFQGLKEV